MRNGPEGRESGQPWVNRLAASDNAPFMRHLGATLKGQIDLVYVDPPFATGSHFSARVRVGESGREVVVPVYEDRWVGGMAGYLDMLTERFRSMRELLSDRGSIYVHLDYRAAARVRCLLDDLFGADSLINEIVWYYKTGGMPERLGFGRKHDTILYYAKDPARAIWNPQKEKSYLTHRYGFSNIAIHEDERGPYTWVNCRDVFDIPALRGNQPERVDFPTQKPEALLERIVLASSHEDSIVADFFCGSGTALVVAERLGRRWIGCDASPLAVHTTAKRLQAMNDVRGYEVIDEPRTDYAVGVSLQREGAELRVALTSVEPEGVDPLPESVRHLIEHWSDRVDWWEVEWRPHRARPRQDGGRGLAQRERDTRFPRWLSQRTRQRRVLELTSAPLSLPSGGGLVVTVADVLGNRCSIYVAL